MQVAGKCSWRTAAAAVIAAGMFLGTAGGCSSRTETPTETAKPATPETAPAAVPEQSEPVPASGATAPESATSVQVPVIKVPSISLGGSSGSSSTPQAATGTGSAGHSSARFDQAVLDAMMPLQIMLGKWRGTTQKNVGDFKALDEPEWIWDFKTDRAQPAMVMTSATSPYFRSARLTYLTTASQFRLTVVDKDNQQRTFEGTFSSPVEEYQGDDNKSHRRYKLELDEVSPADTKDQWQVVFSQQDNNRYLMELAKKRGENYMRFDTVATQRQGTSFALNDEDYGERKCIISGGLGTIQVSYQGKSYWVCCTGCKAAFEDDPVSWIAEYEAKQKSQ